MRHVNGLSDERSPVLRRTRPRGFRVRIRCDEWHEKIRDSAVFERYIEVDESTWDWSGMEQKIRQRRANRRPMPAYAGRRQKAR